MKLDLDAQALEEARVWQQRNFDRQVERIRSILLNFLDTEISQALRFISYERETTMGPRTHSDAAANITSCLVQAVSNCDLRGLNDSAADLSLTVSALGALEALRSALPDELREAWEAAELEARQERDGKRDADTAARDAKHAAQCQAAVHQGGRSVGFRQCGNKGRKLTEYKGSEYRDCGRHEHFHPIREGM